MSWHGLRALLALLTAATLLALLAPAAAPAATGTILEDADATELAQILAEAAEEQGVCYGWEVDLQDDGSGDSGPDRGSNFGPFEPLDTTQCPRWVVLRGSVHYTSESSESEDSSDVWIDSNLADPPTEHDLGSLGFDTDGALHGDDNDTDLFMMAQALPALVAERGEAAFVPFETDVTPVDQQGEPTNKPGSDLLRERWPMLVLAIALILGGIGFIVAKATGVLDTHLAGRWTGRTRSAEG